MSARRDGPYRARGRHHRRRRGYQGTRADRNLDRQRVLDGWSSIATRVAAERAGQPYPGSRNDDDEEGGYGRERTG
jgi:hypothetical protein